MDCKPISFNELHVKVHHLWSKQWMLLTSGDFEKGQFNAMTVGWGSFGVMWNKPFVQVVVRPTRYTYDFMERYDTFTLCAFPDSRRDALQLLGTKSGRDCNKIEESGLTPIVSTKIAAPSFAEAELIFECQKIYWDDMNPAQFINPGIDKNYPQKDYHRIYFGRILSILGEKQYRA